MNNKNQNEKNTKYTYSAENASLLDAFMEAYIVKPLVNKLPYWLPANIITIISNSLVFLSFVIAMQCTKNNYRLWFLIPIFVCIYLIGDCLDGAQARRTKTGSPLGEFLDHFLDTFVNGELIIPILTVYNVKNPYIVFSVLLVAYITQASAFWERFKNGHMHFGKFSSSESILTLTILLTLGCFKNIRDFFAINLIQIEFIKGFIQKMPQWIQNLSIVDAMFIIFVIIAVANTVMTFVRTRGFTVRFGLYILSSAIVAIVAMIMNEDMHHLPCFTLALLNINYIASLLSSIVMKEKDHYPDFFLAIFMTLMLILKISSPILTAFYFIYTIVLVSIRASLFFAKNNKYWVWKNPENKE